MQDSLSRTYARSTLGLKVLMAVTGAVLFGFLIGHVAGNLLVFAGPEKLNAYSQFLHSNKLILYGTRAVLLASVGLHVFSAILLTKRKADARPVPYLGKKPHGSSFASRTMMWSGPVIALFVIYHLLHFTTGQVHPSFNPNDVYSNVVTGFQRPVAALTYILAMLGLGLHLSHGLWSALQTVGINRPHLEPLLRKLAVGVAALLIAAFIAVPVGVLTGIVEAR